jgi:serine/threonine-protein kinase
LKLTAERLAEIRTLWEALVDLPASARESYLLAACPADPELRDQVRTFVAAHESTGEIFARPLLEQLFTDHDPRHAPLLGRTIGAYRIVRELGTGGMGTVYEAVRADAQFAKRVAIKTLRAGGIGAEMLRRFERERRIQAALAHPNIATLLDAGVTDDAIPYIVLEYVDGQPIDAYCEANHLGLPARLDLFRQVIQAVQHAHRQLVVHRDLKPSNILVTHEGTVKLLDFGISKLLGDTTDQTATEGARAFTTAYASPEQIRGQPISTATDVYSLGVVLYRLLAGRVPFDVDGAAPTAAWTRICEEPPAPPSAVATPETAASMGLGAPDRLRRALRGELDAIVLMALRKEPERRYPTADALGEDLHHHLRGLPVQARPDSAGYRIRKLVARNRLAAAALGLAVLAMAGGTGVSLWQARAARHQAAIADAERRTAQGVSEFLQEIFASADPSWAGRGLGVDATIREAIDQAAARIDIDLAAEPAVAEALHRQMVSIYAALHRTEEGKAHARRTLELQQLRRAPGVVLARSRHDLARLYRTEGKLDSAASNVQESYRLFEAAGFPEIEDFAITLNEMALLAWERGDIPAAEAHLARGLELAERVGSEDRLLAVGSSNLGVIREGMGNIAGAEAAFRRAEFFFARAAGGETQERATNLNNLAINLVTRGKPGEAEGAMREALAMWDRTIGPDHPSQGLGRFNLARIQLALGHPAQALETIQAGREVLRELPLDHRDHSRGDVHEAAALLALDRLPAAEQRARRALATRLVAYPPTDWRVAEAEGTLGRVLAARGSLAEARALLTSSHQHYRAAWGANHPTTVEIRRALVAMGTPPP